MVEREIDMNYVLGTSKPTGYGKSFVTNLIKVTQSKDIVEAFDKIEPLYDNDIAIYGDYCLCGHPITVVFYVLNTVTNEKLKIGCECIKKFDRFQIERDKWMPFIEFAEARVKLIKLVREIIKNPEKIYTLNRRSSFIDLLTAANIVNVLPPAFDMKDKPLELVKLDNYKCIKAIISELNITNIDLTPLKEFLTSSDWKEQRRIRELYNLWQLIVYDYNVNKSIMRFMREVLADRQLGKEIITTTKLETQIKYTKSVDLRFFHRYFKN